MIKLDKDAMHTSGINIATGIILDNIDEVMKLEVDKYYFNIDTFLRNYVNCIEGNSDRKKRLLSYDNTLYEIGKNLLNELDIFMAMWERTGIELVFYKLTNETIRNKLKNKIDSYENHRGLKHIFLKNKEKIYDFFRGKLDEFIEERDSDLPSGNILVTTHTGYELLSVMKKENVYLIESHTGEIKDKYKFNTKLRKYGNKRMDIVPFNELTLEVFGDNFILPEPTPIKKLLYNTLEKIHVSPIIRSTNLINKLLVRDFTAKQVFSKIYKRIYDY